MTEEFKAERQGKKLIVKPKVEKRGNDTIVKVPSFKVMNKATKQLQEEEKAQRKKQNNKNK